MSDDLKKHIKKHALRAGIVCAVGLVVFGIYFAISSYLFSVRSAAAQAMAEQTPEVKLISKMTASSNKTVDCIDTIVADPSLQGPRPLEQQNIDRIKKCKERIDISVAKGVGYLYVVTYTQMRDKGCAVSKLPWGSIDISFDYKTKQIVSAEWSTDTTTEEMEGFFANPITQRIAEMSCTDYARFVRI